MTWNSKPPKSIKRIIASAVWKLLASLPMIVFVLVVEHSLLRVLPFS